MKKELPKFLDSIGFINPKKQSEARSLKVSNKAEKGFSIGRVERVKSVEVTEELIEMYDIANCPGSRFSTDGVVTHNTGASIMRKAVEFADELGLDVVVTLHDALYIEYDSGDFEAIDKLHDAMRRGFLHYFPKQKRDAGLIRLDGYTWSPDYEEGEVVTPGGLKIETGSKYVDERATKEYETFKKYFEKRVEELL